MVEYPGVQVWKCKYVTKKDLLHIAASVYDTLCHPCCPNQHGSGCPLFVEKSAGNVEPSAACCIRLHRFVGLLIPADLSFAFSCAICCLYFLQLTWIWAVWIFPQAPHLNFSSLPRLFPFAKSFAFLFFLPFYLSFLTLPVLFHPFPLLLLSRSPPVKVL